MTRHRAPRHVLLVVMLTFYLWPSPSLAAQGTIFVYHRFGETTIPSTNITLSTFASQLEYLAEKSIPVLPLGDVVRHLKNNEHLPERYVVLTVDDGYQSFITGAMPLLRKHGFPITLFVSTASVGARGYLDWEQLRSLHREGVEIGNHSHRHPHLVNLLRERGEKAVTVELRRSQQLFQQQLGFEPRLFAYPFGESLPEIARLLREEGFSCAVVQHSGVIGEHSDLLQLPRFAMGGPYATLEGFVEKSKLYALPLAVEEPAEQILRGDNPPRLVARLEQGSTLRLSDLKCFVAGQPACEITALDGDTQRFVMVADQPLAGRRNRYTLTARDRQGRWHWYSWLWIDPAARE